VATEAVGCCCSRSGAGDGQDRIPGGGPIADPLKRIPIERRCLAPARCGSVVPLDPLPGERRSGHGPRGRLLPAQPQLLAVLAADDGSLVDLALGPAFVDLLGGARWRSATERRAGRSPSRAFASSPGCGRAPGRGPRGIRAEAAGGDHLSHHARRTHLELTTQVTNLDGDPPATSLSATTSAREHASGGAGAARC